MLGPVEVVEDVERSGGEEDADGVAEQVEPRGDLHHLAPLEHLHQQDHHDHVPHLRLQLVQRRDLHPLGPLLESEHPEEG